MLLPLSLNASFCWNLQHRTIFPTGKNRGPRVSQVYSQMKKYVFFNHAMEQEVTIWNKDGNKGTVPNVLPSGSTARANFSASEVLKSELAGDTARMRELGLEMKERMISRTWASISSGWSPTGTWGNNKRALPGSKGCWESGCERTFPDIRLFCQGTECTVVIPGKSTRVRLRTFGEKIFKYIGSGLIPWRGLYKKRIQKPS